jgi:hypothetical protein
MKIGVWGKIIEGPQPGWYLKIDDDRQGETGGFYIYIDENPDSKSGQAFDDWVENEDALNRYWQNRVYQVDWSSTPNG